MNKNPNQSGLKPAMTSDNQPTKRGRPAGVPNKNNIMRAYMENNHPDGIEGYIRDILHDICEIDEPSKRVEKKIALLPYMMPQLKQIDSTLSMDPESGKITIVYSTVTPKQVKPDVDV